MSRQKPAKGSTRTPRGKEVDTWKKVESPVPGRIYCAFSECADASHSRERSSLPYERAVYRSPNLQSQEGREQLEAFCAARLGCADPHVFFYDSYYFSNVIGYNIEATTPVYSGELVFFVDENVCTYRILKGEELLMLDKSYFSLLEVKDY